MFIINRKGEQEPVRFDRIQERIQSLCFGLNELVESAVVTQKVASGVYKGITTTEIDELTAETCAYLSATHPDYSKLAARILVSNLHKNTNGSFAEVIQSLRDCKTNNDQPAPLISETVNEIVQANKERLDNAIVYDRDYEYDFFGFKTLERSYLLRLKNKPVERPQQMLMRVSVGIHMNDIDSAIETYELMSQKLFTHATPTLFNAGTPQPQMSSCFLMTMKDDSIDGIFQTIKNCAAISKTAGGIGISCHNIRAAGSYIRGTNGRSNGLVPMLRVLNSTARYVDQGGGKRKGSFAVYLEPWHADIFEFLDLRKNHGKEEQRARDLFYALWIPDLFMKRVKENGNWTLMCPNECPGLPDVWGDKFEELYTSYEKEGKGRQTIPAQKLWFAVLDAQIETGTPYMVYKDAANRKSNQQHLGTIKSSNLCTEILEYTSPDEVAVCNLASLAVCKFVKSDHTFDYQKLYDIAVVVTKNLNKVIENNYYPVVEARTSNMRHRPIGLGVQGLADTFMLMRLPYESPEAKTVNKNIFETIYFAACTASNELAVAEGPYETFKGSPASEGKLQFDLWGVTPDSGLWDWASLKEKIVKNGLRNSLLLSPMPTASTSQILGNNEAFEPYTSNIYNRRVLSGEFFVVNPHLLRDLIDRNLWNEEMKDSIVASNGSVQNIDDIPADLKELYKTVWEIKQRTVIEMSADRGAFICQSQSLNIHLQAPNYKILTSMHFCGWKAGLKTGMYYLRTAPAAAPIQFTVRRSSKASSVVSATESEPILALSNRPVQQDESIPRLTQDKLATLEKPVVCPMRRPGMESDDECLMCSG
eukprot:GHVL01026367.1.p1 GENE.GHVL01026367.1~~GHVL01026367.1.p1  ORF type:complete len:819 (+),score=112.69 GHVL01026367.1:99-2555(+)